GLPRPKFGGVAEVLRFRAGQMDHPSFGLFRQLLGTAVRCILESSGHPDFQGLADPFGHALPSQVDGAHDGGDAFIRVVKPQNLSALHGTPRGPYGTCATAPANRLPGAAIPREDESIVSA